MHPRYIPDGTHGYPPPARARIRVRACVCVCVGTHRCESSQGRSVYRPKQPQKEKKRKRREGRRESPALFVPLSYSCSRWNAWSADEDTDAAERIQCVAKKLSIFSRAPISLRSSGLESRRN